MAYVDSHSSSGAFLAHRLNRLVDLISEQGDKLLSEARLSLPSRAVSIVLLIDERGRISAADIAKELKQPHQLVTQRIDVLRKLGLVERTVDPSDGRRKILALTRKGKTERRLLETCLRDAERVFLDLYKEIECDLSELALQTIKALSSKSILDRITTVK